MATEIERKFLVKGDGWRCSVASKTRMLQGYLATQENTVIRVRIEDGKATINVKSGNPGLQRAEFEYPIPLRDAEEMLEQIALRPFIEKIRHRVPIGNHTWEVDEFSGDNEGLVMAEIELRSIDEPFERPAWADEEVTANSRYYNANLIACPFKTWAPMPA